MAVLMFGNRLSSDSWAAELRRLHTQFPGSWPHAVAGEEIHVDLSSIGFADFVVLGQLLILLDVLAAANATVVVRLPTGEPLEGERPQDADAAIRQRQRQNCRLFLRQSGFERALVTGNLKVSPPRIVEGAAAQLATATTSLASQRPNEPEAPQVPHRQRKLLPYRWVTPDFGARLTRSARTTSLESRLSGLGLPSETSAALAKGVLAELIENVAEHAQRGSGRPVMALVGGLVIEPAVYSSRTEDFDPALRSLARWSATVSSPLIRLVVADSGRGLLTSLSATPGDASQPSTILDAFDWRSPEPYAVPGPRRGAQGLSKVNRIVRAYQGGLLVLTEGKLACRIFAESSQGSQVTGEWQAWLPGTFVECDILARPGQDAVQSEDAAFTPANQQPGGRPELVCTTVALRAETGLDARDQERIANVLMAVPSASGLVVAVDTPDGGDRPSDTEIGACLHTVLATATQAPSRTPVAVVFPNINRRLLSLAVEDLNRELAESSSRPSDEWRDPILVLAPDDRHYWVGGTLATRRVLQSLSSVSGPVLLETIPPPAGGSAGRAIAIRQIRDRTLLIEQISGTLRLRLRPQDALRTVTHDLSRRIREAIDNPDEVAVRSGRFLTPSLRQARRWCDVGALLRGLSAERLAGFALAAEVKARAALFDPALAPSVLWLGAPGHELVATFTRSLTRTDEYFDSVGGLRLERLSGPRDNHNHVLIITDLVSSGSTLAQAVAQLATRDMVVDAVATVVDARDTKTQDVDVGEIAIGTLRVPLVSLANVDIEPTDADQDLPVIPIDPVLGRPDPTRRHRPHCLVDQDVYIDVLKRVGGARLGHILRPAARHYTAYVDPTLLFRDEDWSNTFIKRALSKIRQSHSPILQDSATAAVTILYPAETSDDIARVARELGAALTSAKIPVSSVVAIPRAVLGTKWLFPASIPLPPETRHVVLLDSGTGTGRTLHQLIRVFAAPAVQVITGIVLLNGLSDLDTLALQKIGSVRPDRASNDIPVHLYFFARTAVSSFDEHDCAICRLRRRYDSLPLLLPVPPRIEKQRAWLLRSLEPRSKRRVFQEEATDLLGTHISQDECVAYLRWKYDFREAAFDTLRRQAVVSDIADATRQPLRRDALVRLMVAEAQWLKSAPLRFPTVRGQVAALAASLVIGESALTIDPALRVQALILLADTDPDAFVAGIRSIALANLNQPLVLGQVLLESLRILAGTVSGSSLDHDRLVQNLVQGLAGLERSLREKQLATNQPDGVPLAEVRYLISYGRRGLQPAPTDPQSAWDALRAYRMSIAEHICDAAMWRLDIMLANLARGAPPRKPDVARDDWRKCRDFLNLDVLPNIRPLRHLLLGSGFVQELSGEDADRWRRVVNGEGPGQLDDIALRLDRLLSEIDGGAESTRHAEELADDLDWWNRFFLATHVDPERPDRSAFLTEIVRQCPTTVNDIARDVFEHTTCEFDFGEGERGDPVQVFCTSSLLREVLTHIRLNAEITHRLAGGKQRFQVTLDTVVSDRVEIVVRNTSSAASGHGGRRGLNALDLELAGFGGRLSSPAQVEPPWTYEIVVSLERWRMM